MCPVYVANEMSGLKGRVRENAFAEEDVASACLSGPSFGTGNENQGCIHTGDGRNDQLDSSGPNPGNYTGRRADRLGLCPSLAQAGMGQGRWVGGI